ncbi:MAG: hypothetical protein KA801_17345 [Syntrophorhabdaceae bacterium]|nr:hypothetical protein [Syntrophorhabdaceae bacterium]
MGDSTVSCHVRDVFEKAGIQTSSSSPFWDWMHPESKKDDAKGEWDGTRLYVRDIPVPTVAPVDVAEIRLSVGDYGIYFAFTLYFYTVLKDAMEAEDFRRIHDTHEIEWFPKLREYYLDVSTRFSLDWDVEYDESIEDTLYRTFAISDMEQIVEGARAIFNRTTAW